MNLSADRKFVAGKWAAFVLLLGLGLFPTLYLFYDGRSAHVEALSVRPVLHSNHFQSPTFHIISNDAYHIGLDWRADPPTQEAPLAIQWAVLDRRGNVLASGEGEDRYGSSSIALTQSFHTAERGPLQLVLDVPSGAPRLADSLVAVDLPEAGLAISYAWLPAAVWALVVCSAALVAGLFGWRRCRGPSARHRRDTIARSGEHPFPNRGTL